MASDPHRLARFVTARRQELGLSQMDVANRGGPSDTTLSKVEAAIGSPNRQTLRKLDIALGWVDGSARQVLENGGEPRPLVDTGRFAKVSADARAEAQAVWEARKAKHSQQSVEELWMRWVDISSETLSVELEYMRRRGLRDPGEARAELSAVTVMAQEGREGRPWMPPWEELSDDEAHDHIDSLRDAGLIDEHGEPIEDQDDSGDEGDVVHLPQGPDLPDLAHPPMPDWSQVAARRGESEGRRARDQQDQDAEE